MPEMESHHSLHGPRVEGNSNWSKQECTHPHVITTRYQDQPLNSARGLEARNRSLAVQWRGS